jgi:hypothetical protein
VERDDSPTLRHAGDPLPALAFVLTCVQCNGSTWRAATLAEQSIMYRCADCGAGICLFYNEAARSWTALAL